MVSEKVKRRTASAIRRRSKTDLRIYPSIVLVVVIAFTATALAYMFGLVGSGADRRLNLLGIFIVGTCVLISMMYLTISRNYQHSKRDIELMNAMCDLAVQMEAEGRFCDVERIQRMREHIPTLTGRKIWVALFVIAIIPAISAPVLALMIPDQMEGAGYGTIACVVSLVLCFAVIVLNMGFPKRHERMFLEFADEFVDGVRASGYNMERYRKVIGVRNLIVMLILTFFTAFLFFGVWLYLSVRDLNRHMDEQWNFEDSIMDLLEVL